MKKLALILSIVACLWTLVGAESAVAAGKVTLNPSSSAINEGQSQIITITLDAPILAPPPGDYVSLSLLSSNPDTVQLSPGTVSYTASEWAQPKQFTVTVPHNEFFGDSRNVTIIARASSGSTYYDGAAASATVQVTDMTDEPPEYDPLNPPTQEEEGEELPVLPQTSSSMTSDPSGDFNAVFSLAGVNNNDIPGIKQKSEAAVKWLTDTYVPGRSSALRTFLGYLALTSVIGASALFLLSTERKLWWQRQQARDARWSNRLTSRKHAKPMARKHSTKRPAKRKR